jgi:hypothetical protein
MERSRPRLRFSQTTEDAAQQSRNQKSFTREATKEHEVVQIKTSPQRAQRKAESRRAGFGLGSAGSNFAKKTRFQSGVASQKQ